jgi:hypothetical protein
MPAWLQILFFRFAAGERMRKATRWDYRLSLAIFMWVPVIMELWSRWNKVLLPNPSSSTKVWLVLTVSMIIWLLIWFLWARFVPAIVSFLLSIPAWGWCVWSYLHKIHYW